MNLKDYLKRARQEHWAVGHFNFSTADQLKAFIEVATEMNSAIMVGTSEGEADFFGIEQAVALVKSYQAQGHTVWLNADHFHSFEKSKTAIDAGYDSIIIDASKLPYEENVALTKQVVEYAHSVNPDISIEGELGYLRGSSEVQTKIEITPSDYTQPEQAVDFVMRTSVDRLAVVFGNIHGIVTDQEEMLDIEHFKKIIFALSSDLTMVLHGASGLKPEDVEASIRAGISNAHINTDLRVAYHGAIMEEFREDPAQTTPYKFLQLSYEASKKIVRQKLELFGAAGKI